MIKVVFFIAVMCLIAVWKLFLITEKTPEDYSAGFHNLTAVSLGTVLAVVLFIGIILIQINR